jgi:HK97 family phage major capsid protein
MAITAASTLSSDFSGFLNREQAQPIFERAAKVSVFQQLAREVPLGGNGVSIPVVTGRPTAGWVSEGAAKPASSGTMTLKNMDPKKLAVIAVVSAEVVRGNPGNYMNLLRPQIAEAFAVGFDLAAAHDMGPDGTAAAGPFSTYLDQTANSVEIGTGTTIQDDFVSALTLLIADDSRLTGFALGEELEPTLWSAKDSQNRPLYIDLPSGDMDAPDGTRRGRLLNRPALIGEGVSTPNGTSVVGYAGDWSQAAWGVVGGITYDVSTQATVTINGAYVSLWENNLVAIRAEAEYGWVVNDTDSFVKFTNAV